MDITIIDNAGAGILSEFARSIGATVKGRFVYIPENKGGGYLTGFNWGPDLRVMIRNYYLKEEISVNWTNNAISDQEPVVFQLTGMFQTEASSGHPIPSERSNVLICRQMVTSLIAMPSNTAFGSVTIAVSKTYLQQLFGNLDHPIIHSILADDENFAYETSISKEMFNVANEILHQPVSEKIERQFYKIKCEELLCYIFSMLIDREPLPTTHIHIDDIKAVYAIKLHLQAHLNTPPDISQLAANAGMSDRKLRRLFNQIFGKPVFEYYQSLRMQEAARLLREKQLSVSQVGYSLGFTNLSHFSKLFAQHLKITPKKYVATN